MTWARLLGVIAGGQKTSGTSLVTLLLHCEGSQGGTSFTDSSINGFSITTVGNATTSNSLGVAAGSTAMVVSSTSASSGVSFAGNAINSTGTGEFTVEAMVTLASAAAVGVQRSVWELSGGGHFLAVWLQNRVGSTEVYFSITSSTATNSGTTATTFPVDSAPHHLCFMRSGGTGKIFLDGVAIITTSAVGGTSSFALTGPFLFGGASGGPGGLNGAMDEIRFTKKAVYNMAGFTVPSLPLSATVT